MYLDHRLKRRSMFNRMLTAVAWRKLWRLSVEQVRATFSRFWDHPRMLPQGGRRAPPWACPRVTRFEASPRHKSSDVTQQYRCARRKIPTPVARLPSVSGSAIFSVEWRSPHPGPPPHPPAPHANRLGARGNFISVASTDEPQRGSAALAGTLQQRSRRVGREQISAPLEVKAMRRPRRQIAKTLSDSAGRSDAHQIIETKATSPPDCRTRRTV
jgi:hypothetical protein